MLLTPALDFRPPILFDVVYLETVFQNFGIQTLKYGLATTGKDAFHPRAAGERATAVKGIQVQEQKHEARNDACYGPDTFDLLLALPYIYRS